MTGVQTCALPISFDRDPAMQAGFAAAELAAFDGLKCGAHFGFSWGTNSMVEEADEGTRERGRRFVGWGVIAAVELFKSGVGQHGDECAAGR